MFLSRSCGGAGGVLLFLCVSSKLVHGLNKTVPPGTPSTIPSTASVSMTTPAPSVPSASMTTNKPTTVSTPSVSMETTSKKASLSTETQRLSNTSTQSVFMITLASKTSASVELVSTDEPVTMMTSVSSNTPVPTASDTTETTPVSTTNPPTTPDLSPPNAEHFKAVHQTESNITLQWSIPVNSSFNYTLRFEEKIINITGGPAGAMNYTVRDLEPAMRYNFTLSTRKQNIFSSGVSTWATTAPVRIANVMVVDQNSSSIHLQWHEVKNITSYWVEYRDGCSTTTNTRVEVPAGQAVVNFTAPALCSATCYTFTIYSRLENSSSIGFSISAVTAPVTVTEVEVKRKPSTVVLSWSRDGNSSYHLRFGDQNFSPVPTEPRSHQVTAAVPSLQEGTSYNYSIIASYQYANSSTYQNYTVTTINCPAVQWRVTNSTIHALVTGLFTNVNATNGSQPNHAAQPDSTGSVSLTGLYPGATYKLMVWYGMWPQCEHNLTLPPPDIRAHCQYGSPDTIVLEWAPPGGVWTSVEVNVTGRDPLQADKGGKLKTVLAGFQPAKTYRVSTSLLSGDVRSTVQILDCATDSRGVIAGSLASVLAFLLLVALVVFFWQRRRSSPQRHKSDFVGWSKATDTYKPITADLFEDHVGQMSRDEYRGFSEEYENFIPVGTEQTCKAAVIPDNKIKNRFTNVLPYDWSRVKLSMLIEEENSDYINASFLPGYSGSREYIAAQGPLPATVDDFWRMVWEQGVSAIAMVTNCIEGDRIKCEQYWPLDYTPCLYGDLLVTSTSEQMMASWTIRSFNVKNRVTSEQRSVQHFHFRAWPDHGVPDGTGPLLQFRALLRQHIEQEGGGAPTLVHCSAGVGRTGTLVALDVLLQQLEAEGKVDVASFVQKMRLSRTLMVQTESQYIFLHRCLLEAIQRGAAEDENPYQNWDIIYANATALQELPSSI